MAEKSLPTGNSQEHLRQKLTLAELEQEYIISIIEYCDWDLNKTALVLGVGRSTVYRKILEYGIKIQKRKRNDKK